MAKLMAGALKRNTHCLLTHRALRPRMRAILVGDAGGREERKDKEESGERREKEREGAWKREGRDWVRGERGARLYLRMRILVCLRVWTWAFGSMTGRFYSTPSQQGFKEPPPLTPTPMPPTPVSTVSTTAMTEASGECICPGSMMYLLSRVMGGGDRGAVES